MIIIIIIISSNIDYTYHFQLERFSLIDNFGVPCDFLDNIGECSVDYPPLNLFVY